MGKAVYFLCQTSRSSISAHLSVKRTSSTQTIILAILCNSVPLDVGVVWKDLMDFGFRNDSEVMGRVRRTLAGMTMVSVAFQAKWSI
jgi:hypothetical protein